MTAGRFVGQAVARREDPRLLTGRGTYLEDIRLPGMLHAAFVRSSVARGTITRLDVSDAEALDGVRAVFTGSDLNPLVREHWTGLRGRDATYAPPYTLAQDDVRYVGDPVAIIVADSRHVAEDAVERVLLEVEPQDPLLDPEVVAEAEDFVHPEVGTNVPARIDPPPDPDLDRVFDAAAHVVSATFRTHRYIHVPMETRGIIGDWDDVARELTIHASSQSAHELRAFYSRLLGLPDSRVRVRVPDVGGGFGLKVMSLRDEWAVVMASMQLATPVRWIEDRHENLVASAHARDERMTLEAAVDANGCIQGLRVDHLENVGAYPYPGPGGASRMVSQLITGPYRIPHASYRTRAVYTNTCGRAPYRGPFLMETVGPEQLVDVVARQLELDPVEVRRRNVVGSQDLPYELPSGAVYRDITPQATLEQAVEMVGYDQFRSEQRHARTQGRYLGLGISLCVEPTAISMGALSTEAVALRMGPGGRVDCVLSSSDTGMSVATTMVQIIADELGCCLDAISFSQGDTRSAPHGGGTQGSRSAVLYGNAVLAASRAMRDKLLAIASHAMEAAEDDLELRDGRVSVLGDPTASMSFAELAEIAYTRPAELPPGMDVGLEETSRYHATPITFANACHICTVEIDAATGRVDILRYVVSEDCGRLINPAVVEGQVRGGVAQGIGGVLYEAVLYDEMGNPLTSTFLDYLVPTAAEIPRIEISHIETPADNPLGVKGVGEGGAVAAPAAVFNAVADALAPLGITVRDTPLGPAQILDLLMDAGH